MVYCPTPLRSGGLQIAGNCRRADLPCGLSHQNRITSRLPLPTPAWKAACIFGRAVTLTRAFTYNTLSRINSCTVRLSPVQGVPGENHLLPKAPPVTISVGSPYFLRCRRNHNRSCG